ncbi:MAG: ABC transporter substrate-binding protein [Holosporales bacterium]|jgi:polar amino acid transport system substrate-binding protein|nr:ABC transporter substrate-binding protein [Holosporales bacterium]
MGALVFLIDFMIVALRGFLFSFLLALCGCEERKDDSVITFGTSADYRPFEYYEDGKLTGFEIDLANAIANKLGKTANFEDMPFSSLLAGLENGTIDAVASSLVPTEERRRNYDFTVEYYGSVIAFIHGRDNDRMSTDDLSGVKIACQLGSVPEAWMKKNRPKAEIVTIDNVAQSVELIRAGRVDGILVDGIIASTICRDNPDLKYTVVDSPAESADNGFAMAVKKGSTLRELLDNAIQQLDDSGELRAIKEKWNLVSE